MQKSNDNKVSGLPEIAGEVHKNKMIILVVIAVLVMMMVIFFIQSKSKKVVAQPVEESYSIDAEVSQQMKVGEITGSRVSNQAVEQPSKEEVAVRMELLQAKQQELKQRLSAPLMLVNETNEAKDKPAGQSERDKDGNPNTQFMQNVASKEVQVSMASAIGSLNTIIAEGTFIHATLEPATNSDLPGALRAMVAEPTYSEDGSRVLIPRGSRLIGEYKSGMQQGQSRIFVVWRRLITPDGMSVQLGSFGVDSLGVSGMNADSIDRHFWERFGTASLLSMIGTGAATVGVASGDQENSASAYRTAISNSFAQSANQSVQQQGAIPPTLTTVQGKPIMVFVARDLQFAGALKATQPSVNVF